MSKNMDKLIAGKEIQPTGTFIQFIWIWPLGGRLLDNNGAAAESGVHFTWFVVAKPLCKNNLFFPDS